MGKKIDEKDVLIIIREVLKEVFRSDDGYGLSGNIDSKRKSIRDHYSEITESFRNFVEFKYRKRFGDIDQEIGKHADEHFNRISNNIYRNHSETMDYISSEKFIDDIVERIKKKQLS